MELALADGSPPVRVTKNHPYWSEDRQEFIPAGELRVGEKLSTLSGPVAVASTRPIDYAGFLHNLETTEHVYQVGASGALVHNECGVRIGKTAFDDVLTKGLHVHVRGIELAFKANSAGGLVYKLVGKKSFSRQQVLSAIRTTKEWAADRNNLLKLQKSANEVLQYLRNMRTPQAGAKSGELHHLVFELARMLK